MHRTPANNEAGEGTGLLIPTHLGFVSTHTFWADEQWYCFVSFAHETQDAIPVKNPQRVRRMVERNPENN
jgi:hypothetical protein